MYSKILVPVAFDHQADVQPVLTLAKALKKPEGEVIILTVIEPVPASVEAYLPGDLRAKQYEDTESFVKDIAAKVEGPARTEILVGAAGPTILELAEKAGCDCIILHSHKPGLEDYFLGSTASRVVRHAPCSVHVLR